MLIVLPQRIRGDVGHLDWLAAEGGGAARTHHGSDEHPIDGFGVVLREARARDVTELLLPIDGKHRADH